MQPFNESPRIESQRSNVVQSTGKTHEAIGAHDSTAEERHARHRQEESPMEDGAPSAVSKEPARESARDMHHVLRPQVNRARRRRQWRRRRRAAKVAV